MATELISFNPSSKQFAVAPKAVDILKKLHGPVAIVSVCGRARMGKSTLLNQLLSKLSGGTQQGAKGGFTVASTHKPCTKGLWIWSKPIERTMPDGRKMHLVGPMCMEDVQLYTPCIPVHVDAPFHHLHPWEPSLTIIPHMPISPTSLRRSCSSTAKEVSSLYLYLYLDLGLKCAQ